MLTASFRDQWNLGTGLWWLWDCLGELEFTADQRTPVLQDVTRAWRDHLGHGPGAVGRRGLSRIPLSCFYGFVVSALCCSGKEVVSSCSHCSPCRNHNINMSLYTLQQKHEVTTSFGPISVLVCGDRRKPALVTYPDVGMNCELLSSLLSIVQKFDHFMKSICRFHSRCLGLGGG